MEGCDVEKNQIAIYQNEDNTVAIEVLSDGDTVWLNRQQMAALFGRDIKTIGKHVANALEEELSDYSVVAKFATTASDGKTYQVEYYNLDMVISVGYRVKSSEGIRFRQWATQILKSFLIEGAAINEKRLIQIDRIAQILARSADKAFAILSVILPMRSRFRYLHQIV